MRHCNLIATIPTMLDMKKVINIISNPMVKEVRWNTGIVSMYNEFETLRLLKELCSLHDKRLWVDIKGRQLRVKEWGNPLYSSIKLNHNIIVNGTATVFLRGEPPLRLMKVKGNEIYVDPIPHNAVGAGQSVNIIGKDVHIIGYLTDKDKKYLEACKELGINDIMASFVEGIPDLLEIQRINDKSNIVCKIESEKGLNCIDKLNNVSLMAARDDLYIELANPYYMLHALKSIIEKDKNAICASRIFTSLEFSYKISFSDFQDLENMYAMGYRNFMLCDNVCNYAFDKAIRGWELFLNER